MIRSRKYVSDHQTYIKKIFLFQWKRVRYMWRRTKIFKNSSREDDDEISVPKTIYHWLWSNRYQIIIRFSRRSRTLSVRRINVKSETENCLPSDVTSDTNSWSRKVFCRSFYQTNILSHHFDYIRKNPFLFGSLQWLSITKHFTCHNIDQKKDTYPIRFVDTISVSMKYYYCLSFETLYIQQFASKITQ